jgi:hypothetical protein
LLVLKLQHELDAVVISHPGGVICAMDNRTLCKSMALKGKVSLAEVIQKLVGCPV